MNSVGRIPTNLRTLLILEILGNSDKALTPTEINSKIGLPKQTVHRLCATLEAEGYLGREPGGKRLFPSARSRQLASGIIFNSRSQISIQQILVGIASKVRETINFVVPRDQGMMYFDRVETDWPFRIQLPVGSNVPFHCTASGKTFIASMPPAKRMSFVKSIRLEKLTPNTFTDESSLLIELSRVSEQGFAVDNEEFIEGMIAVAVPIFDRKSRFCAALAFHAPVQRMSLEAAVSHRQSLIEAARKISETLFMSS